MHPEIPLRSILLADDDPDIRTIAQMTLETLGGFRVRISGCGDEALTMAAEEMPDLLILDVMMPDKDGPATLFEFRERLDPIKRVPVIFLTAKVQPREINAFRQLGAADVIAKPFDPMSLPVDIQNLWRRITSRAA